MKYTYQVTAEDADGDAIKFRLTTKPLNMSIDSLTGCITWYPKFLDLGTHSVIIEARDPMGGMGRQQFSLNVGDMKVYTVDTVINAGDTLMYPVLVTPLDEFGVIAGNVELSYSASQFTVLDIDTAGSIISGATMARSITSSMVSVAFAAAAPFTGEGALFRMKVLVNGEYCGTTLRFTIQKAFFNDGSPAAARYNGAILMKCGGAYAYDIGGTVTYAGNGGGVAGAKCALNELGLNAETSADGAFLFPKVPRSSQPYTIGAAKDSGDIRDGGSAYDASLILRAIVGQYRLDAYSRQADAADVNGNAMLTAYDAALILRFLVGINDATKIGRWTIEPSLFTIRQHVAPVTNLSANAFMIGDVSGNWNRSGDGMPRRLGGGAVTITMNEFEAAQTKNDADSLQAFTSLITVENPFHDVYSGQITIAFDATNYRLNRIKPLAMLNGYTSAANQAGSEILMAFAGTEPLGQSGALFEVEVAPLHSGATAAGLSGAAITCALYNETSGATRIVNGVRRVPAASRAVKTGIASMYPNPVTTRVAVDFALASSGRIRLSVYDLQGREVVRLVDRTAAQGMHSIVWNLHDAQGQRVGAQTYLLRFACGKFVQDARLYVVK